MIYETADILKDENDVILAQLHFKTPKTAYAIFGNGPTLYFDDYESALKAYTQRLEYTKQRLEYAKQTSPSEY